MAALASSSSTIYENMSDVQSIDTPLEEMRLEDSGTFDADSPSDSNEQINGVSCSPSSQCAAIAAEPALSYSDDKHIYTNIREMDEINNRPSPPVPGVNDRSKRNLNNGWMEYESEAGRTYFFNSESGKSQWIPPRFIRTPAQVQAFLKATRQEVDEFACESQQAIETSDEIPYHSAPPPPLSENHPAPTPSATEEDTLDHDQSIQDPHGANHSQPPRSRTTSERAAAADRNPSRSPPPRKTSGDPVMMSSFTTNMDDGLGAIVQSNSATNQPRRDASSSSAGRGSSPSTARSHSFKNRHCQLKNVPLPQVLPTTSGFQPFDCGTQTLDRRIPRTSEEYDSDERRGSSGENREPVRTIRCGNMERIQVDAVDARKKREWISNFMYLTSAHLILYKDQKAAEKHGNHYAPPLGVCDLRGATVSWSVLEKERKKKKVMQLELSYGPKYLLRTATESDTVEWFEALRDVINKLPASTPCSGLPLHPSSVAVLDPSCAVVRNPSSLSNRPHSTALLNTAGRGSSRRVDHVMAQSAIESTGTGDEPRVSRETILERLRRFFRTRPSVESLKEKGIYKPEPVFGSTLSAICQLENSLVPKFIRTVTELIENKGLEVDGLYRVSGNLSAIQRIRCQVDQDKYTSLVNEEDVHVLTGALKLFFRELAEPVFPTTTTKDYLSAIKIQILKQRFKRFDELLKALPTENKETLKMLLRHLHRVAAHSDKNRMQAHNLAIMFGPTLFHNGDEKSSAGAAGRKKDSSSGAAKKNKTKKDDPPPVQSNSHLAFNMIMQGQIVEYLLNEHSRFEALQGPIQTHPS